MTQKEIDTKFEIAKILVKHLECDTSKVLSPLYDYLQEQLLIHSVGNHVFCPHCGDKRQLKVETDLNSGRVCKSRLCKGK